MKDLPLIDVNTTDFVFGQNKYRKDERARNSLNACLETDYVAVFRRDCYWTRQWNAQSLVWDCEKVFVLTKSGRVIQFYNSEWASFYVVKD